jgi:hypothetical protein
MCQKPLIEGATKKAMSLLSGTSATSSQGDMEAKVRQKRLCRTAG